MRKKAKSLAVFMTAIYLLGGAICGTANAEYVPQESYSTVIDGNNGGERLETSSAISSYLIQNIHQDPEGDVSGGGLFSWGGTVENSLIQNNSGNLGGGAYLITGVRQVNNTKFLGNRAEYLGGGLAFGGSSSSSRMYQVWHCVFEDNEAGTRGGAIHINDTPDAISIQNTDFINNRAGQEGGAIYLDIGDATFMSNITANDGQTHVFSGNMQGVEEGYHRGPSSNAIYIQRGKIDIQTAGKAGSSYIINDGIEGSSIDNAKMDISSSAEGGRIELNNQIKNISLNHKRGTLILNASNQLADGTPIMKNVDLTITADGKNDLRFDMANGKIDTLQVRNLTIKEQTGNKEAVIAFDVDFNEGKSDLFEVSGNMKGGINFDTDHFELNVLEDGNAENFQLFSKMDDTFKFQGELIQYNGDTKYKLSVGENGVINIQTDATNGLADAVATAEGVREYKAVPNKDIFLKESLGTMSGESLRIDMNNNMLDGGKTQGITVLEGQRLEVKNTTGLNNFYSQDSGSVINNTNGTITITDSVVSNNKSDGLGGAIYSQGGEVIINADTKDVVFKNNFARNNSVSTLAADETPVVDYVSNDIHIETLDEATPARLTFNSTKNTTMESGISGNGEIQKNGVGTLTIGGNNSNFTGDVYYNQGMVSLAKDAQYFNARSTHFANNSGINLINNDASDKVNFGELHMDGTAHLGVDVDPSKGINDKIGADAVYGDGNFVIDRINVTGANKTASNIKFNVVSVDENNQSPLLGRVEMGAAARQDVLGPIYKYKTTYDPKTGMFSLSGGGKTSDGYNPAVLAAPVGALVGGYLTQLNSYDMAFYNSDMYMLKTREEREAIKMRNRYASSRNTSIVTNNPNQDETVWFKPYSSFENVKLENGPKVSNVAYGSFFGYDSDLKELGHGFDGMWSAYGGYTGSHQSFSGTSIYQNGGNLGASGVVFKGNFFSALTANVGASVAEASTMYGNEDFTMLMAGIASKSGYNWEVFRNRLIIQPNYLMSYSFVNAFDYNNGAGVDISSKPLNAIQIAPGLKIIGNLPYGWKPYLSCAMVWNLMDDTNFKAYNVDLPELSVKPYFNYGLGVQKSGERVSGFLQALLRAGGRNGIALHGGMNVAVGK